MDVTGELVVANYRQCPKGCQGHITVKYTSRPGGHGLSKISTVEVENHL